MLPFVLQIVVAMLVFFNVTLYMFCERGGDFGADHLSDHPSVPPGEPRVLLARPA
jgi:hypothetical protein